MMRPKLRVCVYCGKDRSAGKLSSEHFVPKCLWVTKPPKIKIVPAHIDCNGSFSDDNEYFRDMLAMEHHDFEHPELKKVREVAMKSKMEKCIGSLAKSLATAKVRSIYTDSGIYVGEEPTCVLNRERIDRVLSNTVRGIYYHQTEKLLSASTKIQIFWQKELRAPGIQNALGYMHDKPWHNFGDDVFGVKWVFNPNYPESMACLMQFYRSRVYFGRTIPEGLEDMIVKRTLAEMKAQTDS